MFGLCSAQIWIEYTGFLLMSSRVTCNKINLVMFMVHCMNLECDSRKLAGNISEIIQTYQHLVSFMSVLWVTCKEVILRFIFSF